VFSEQTNGFIHYRLLMKGLAGLDASVDRVGVLVII